MKLLRKRKKPQKKFDFEPAKDVKELIAHLVNELGYTHIKLDQLHCVRSSGSKARAYARVWGLSRIFQVTAGYKPTYVIEVLSHYYDKLSEKEKIKVLIHELMHIPKTFSGALKSHKGPHHTINNREVSRIYDRLGK